MEILARGFALVEAPREAPDGSVYFSDVTRGGVYTIGSDGTVDTVVPKRRGVGAWRCTPTAGWFSPGATSSTFATASRERFSRPTASPASTT